MTYSLKDKVRITSPELPPTAVQYRCHVSPAVSRDKVSSYTPFHFSFTVPLGQTLGQSAAARTTRRPRQSKNTFLKGGGPDQKSRIG